jgi:hypothetical protein
VGGRGRGWGRVWAWVGGRWLGRELWAGDVADELLRHDGRVQGNHEIEVLDDERGFLAYEARFYFPSEQSESPFYYSYEVRRRAPPPSQYCHKQFSSLTLLATQNASDKQEPAGPAGASAL